MNHKFEEKRVTRIEYSGHMILPTYVSEAMGWEPGTEIMGTKVDGMLILQQFQPRCCVCQSVLHVKKVHHTFICEKCIACAEKSTIYEHCVKVWDEGEGYEDECVEEIGELCDYGYDDENEEDYDSDEFMRSKPS